MNVKTKTDHLLIAPSFHHRQGYASPERRDSFPFEELTSPPAYSERKVQIPRQHSPIERQRSFSQDVPSSETSSRYPYVDNGEGDSSSSCCSSLHPVRAQKDQICQYGYVEEVRDIDREAVNHYMEMYFKHANSGAAQSFLSWQEGFLHWLNTTEVKSQEDLILIYAILAVGTLFSPRPERGADGSLFCNIARDAMQEHQCESSSSSSSSSSSPPPSPGPLSQARIMIALYSFSCGRQDEAWALAALGLPAAFELESRNAKTVAQPRLTLGKRKRKERVRGRKDIIR